VVIDPRKAHDRQVRRLLVLLVFALLASACAGHGNGSSSPRAVTVGTLADWPTYHRTTSRSGFVATGPTGPLQAGWTKDLTGAVYGEPLVVGSTLVVATEEDHIYGLDARTGTQLWDTKVGFAQPGSGLPCGDIDPLGITGTPAYDSVTGSVFVVAETRGGNHRLWALSLTDGAKRWSRSLDTQPDRNKLAEQQRPASLVVGNRVITPFGGLAGDCQNYVGYVTSAPTSGHGAIQSYAIPTAREGGIWGTPGAVLAGNGNIYVAAGNGAELTGTWDKSDSVTALNPDTLVRQSVFAPAEWRDDNVNDHDLGSMSPAVVTQLNRLVIAGKRGTVYLLRPNLGGVGSEVTSLLGCKGFGGAAVTGTTVLMPCRGPGAIRALTVGLSTLSWSWSRTGIYGSPVIAGDKVYVADSGSGDLVVLKLADGSIVERHHAGTLQHFPSEVVSGDWVFVSTMTGVTAFHGS
jgi:polyvinyl alcohol dehydrogenase (cytochrome)